MAEVILPGVYITVKDEGLITAGGVASGNIGIVGTASKGEDNKVVILGSFTEAKEIFLGADKEAEKNFTLLSALEQIYNNGGRTVYAVKASDAADDAYKAALEKLENEIVNIIVIAGEDASKADILQAHLNSTAQIKRERIGIIESDKSGVEDIANHTLDSGRMILVTPHTSENIKGSMAASVAGLIASLPVQTSPTNKTLAIKGLEAEFNSSKLEKLVQKRVLCVEKREGYRIVKGITTATNSAWAQITTRRIVDYAIYGVRSACNPYIGKLNNERVRSAMKATIDAFLTRMIQNEALVKYELEVTAARSEEIQGKCMVTMKIAPTFSIDYIMVTMYLE